MMAFISSAAVISPQKTLGRPGFPDEILNYPETSFLRCIEPVYRDFLDPMASRRMSRIIKMGVYAALSCLRNAEVDLPDAIIAGTGLGCLEDTEKFLASVYTSDERLLNPTPFIQSTHNTLAGAIALAIKCHGYNATYTHRGFSFESAIIDALMQIHINPDMRVLTGGFDELTTGSYAITKRLGLWRVKPVGSLSLLTSSGKGTLPGEGQAFFLLSGKKGQKDLARLISVRTLFEPANNDQVEDEILNFVTEAGLSLSDIDLAILGMNGDRSTDSYYYHLMEDRLRNTPSAGFKHLCGEYDTASSFALWLASEIVHSQHLPESILLGDRMPGRLNNILIYNHLRGINHSMILVSAC
jgi:3-oxoacyl-(acyl-carrier-protein) synthase